MREPGRGTPMAPGARWPPAMRGLAEKETG